MANGMEMLVTAAIKATGLDPNVIKVQAAEAFSLFQAFAAEFKAMNERTARMEAMLQAMENRIVSAINGDLDLPDDVLLGLTFDRPNKNPMGGETSFDLAKTAYEAQDDLTRRQEIRNGIG